MIARLQGHNPLIDRGSFAIELSDYMAVECVKTIFQSDLSSPFMRAHCPRKRVRLVRNSAAGSIVNVSINLLAFSILAEEMRSI